MRHHSIFRTLTVLLIVCFSIVTGRLLAADSNSEGIAPSGLPRAYQPPRKVLVGTVVGGDGVYTLSLQERYKKMDGWVENISAKAGKDYPGKRLDLVVLTEFLLANPGASLAQKVLKLDEVLPRIAECARRYQCYIVVGTLLDESHETQKFTNAALLVGRDGSLVGIYRKVHPPALQGSDVLEDGETPGSSFPVFQCDFGRLGMETCFDMLYPDGWSALAKNGAEIVALPSASPDTVHPSIYAQQYQYYIVSSVPHDHSAVYSPLGLIEAQATNEGEVLVDQIDLSFALLHWDEALDDGAELTRKYGTKVGYRYYHSEDMGIFWSNDPAMPIGRMLASVGQLEVAPELERIRLLQDKARGGPPAVP
jgi:predicted amidohydrolase